MKEFIDHTIFMGMHHHNEKVRIACKNFFAQRLKKTIHMSLEDVGKCDDVVWHFERKTQDSYYPFMDRLHTIMNIKRIPYGDKTILNVKKYKKSNLSTKQRLTLATAENGILYTFDKHLLNLNLKYVRRPSITDKEMKFPSSLEVWYKKSLKLKTK